MGAKLHKYGRNQYPEQQQQPYTPEQQQLPYLFQQLHFLQKFATITTSLGRTRPIIIF
jgi:hypothetical protein